MVSYHQTKGSVKAQIELEKLMHIEGMERVIKDRMAKEGSGEHHKTDYGKNLMNEYVEAMEKAIMASLIEVYDGSPGKRQPGYSIIKTINDPLLLAAITVKCVISAGSKFASLLETLRAIGEEVSDLIRYSPILGLDKKKWRMIEKKLCKEKVMSKKRSFLDKQMLAEGLGLGELEDEDKLHVGRVLLDICLTHLSLIQLEHGADRTVQVVFTEESNKVISEAIVNRESGAVFRLPMVSPPKRWTNPVDGGYLKYRNKLIKKSYSAEYLEEVSKMGPQMKPFYNAINSAQQTRFRINTGVMETMLELARGNDRVAGLPNIDSVSLPPEPSFMSSITESEWTETQQEEAKEYRKTCWRLRKGNLEDKGTRVLFLQCLADAEYLAQYEALYIPYTVDWRGRMYALPVLNPQGSGWMKGLFTFADGLPITGEAWKWLAIHGANSAGIDKVSFEDRVNWVLRNSEAICAVASNPLDDLSWTGENPQTGEKVLFGGDKVCIDSPWQFLAFAIEWAGWVKEGEGYISRLPIALDGSCNGIQHFAGNLRCESTARMVNLIPQDKPADFYSETKEEVIRLMEASEDEAMGDFATHWLTFGIVRSTVKRPCMTLAYGSGRTGFRDQILTDTLNPAKRQFQDWSGKNPNASVEDKKAIYPFDNEWTAANALAGVISKALEAKVTSAVVGMKYFQQIAGLVGKDNQPLHWNTPTGFPVKMAKFEEKLTRVESTLNGIIYRMAHYKKKEDKVSVHEMRNGVSPSVIHSLDASHMMLTINACVLEGVGDFVLIHDSFATHAANTDIMFRQIREQFVTMYESFCPYDELEQRAKEILPEKDHSKMPQKPIKGNLDLALVKESSYFFA